ncbi:pyrroloquinoline quinone (PQQ) biosynthesis protein C [Aminobacter sp. BE322]
MPEGFTEAKDFLLANMYEEEIGGDRHTDLLIRFGEASSTTADRMRDPDNMSPTTRALQSWCYAVAMREDPIVAVAGLVVGLESQVPSIYRKQTPTPRDKYGFTDEEVELFDLMATGQGVQLLHDCTRTAAASRHERSGGDEASAPDWIL